MGRGNNKSNQITVELIMPSPLAGRPHKAIAVCQARLTKAQIIVESGEIIQGSGVALGGLPYRFNRKTGRRIPYIRGGWRLSGGVPE